MLHPLITPPWMISVPPFVQYLWLYGEFLGFPCIFFRASFVYFHFSSTTWRSSRTLRHWASVSPPESFASSLAASQPPGVRTGRCWTGGSGDSSLCPGASRCVSERGTRTCGTEPAAAGWSDLWSGCPGSPQNTTQPLLLHNHFLAAFVSLVKKWNGKWNYLVVLHLFLFKLIFLHWAF